MKLWCQIGLKRGLSLATGTLGLAFPMDGNDLIINSKSPF